MIFNNKFNGRTLWAWIRIGIFISGLIASGAILAYKVNHNEEAITEIEIKQDADHDILIRIETIVEEINKKID